jgi:hypothetical protein
VYEKPLEAVLPAPQLRFDAIQLPAPPARELQLAFDVLERLRRDLSLHLWVHGLLESLTHEVERVLGLKHAAGCLLCRAEHPPQLRDRLPEGRFSCAFLHRRRRGEGRLYLTRLQGRAPDLLPVDPARA